jgi:hypothetical protein
MQDSFSSTVGGGIVKVKHLLRFSAVDVLDDPQVIVPQGQGALTSAVKCHPHTPRLKGN